MMTLVAEGKHYALRAIEVGADDALALSSAANFFGYISKDAETADAIIDQAVAVNPNYFIAWQTRAWISVYLGRHERAIEQFQYAMRLNPLDPVTYSVEAGLAWTTFFLRRFETALSWATKSLARQENYGPAIGIAMLSFGRIDDAQTILVRRRETGTVFTISQIRKRVTHYRQEDVELLVEAYRIAGVPE